MGTPSKMVATEMAARWYAVNAKGGDCVQSPSKAKMMAFYKAQGGVNGHSYFAGGRTFHAGWCKQHGYPVYKFGADGSGPKHGKYPGSSTNYPGNLWLASVWVSGRRSKVMVR